MSCESRRKGVRQRGTLTFGLWTRRRGFMLNTHTEIAKILDKLKLFLAVSQLAYLIRCCEVSAGAR